MNAVLKCKELVYLCNVSLHTLPPFIALAHHF